MSIDACFRSSFLLACVLLSASAVMAQDDVRPRGPAADHGDAHTRDDTEFAHAEYHVDRPRESFLGWMIRAMGPIGLLIPVAAFFGFVLALVVVIRGQGPFALAALVFLVPIPFLLGLLGAVYGMILSLQVIATSSVAPKPSELSDGIATALFTPLLGLVCMAPGYLVAVLGSLARSFSKSVVTPGTAR